mmetsp:Transcript_18820/g.59145  ORF Transcript_18820/g.59145 Transcript_18820/m.59145 type:complete len:529 (-) Transcript_18820:78-1664(-)
METAKRRRVKVEKFGTVAASSNREEELFQQAVINSRQEKQLARLPIEEAPVFRPSAEEFGGDPLAYIEKIREVGEQYGICVIEPPASWGCGIEVGTSELRFATKLQRIDRLQESVPYGDGRTYTPASYKEMADAFAARWLETHPGGSLDRLREDYWSLVDGAAERVSVEYGNDVDGTAFPADAESPWTLTRLPKLSLLKHFKVQMKGINTPWLYFGMLFSTFSWHNEDNYLASINYHHLGAPKQWYGVPGSHAAAFESVVRRFYKQRLLEVPDLLHHMNTMFSPSKLKALEVPVYQATQKAGSFVVTFPRAFHSGFSYGFNLGEAVNFAPPSWIDHAKVASERYRRVGRLAVVSHDRLVFTLASLVDDFSDKFEECDLLRKELDRLCKEEFNLRPRLFAAGVRDVSGLVAPPRNQLGDIDARASEYDDKRVCVVCRHTCFSSAVACNCSQTAVSCLRHSSYLCKCPPSNKYLIEWESQDHLRQCQDALRDKLKRKFPQQMLAALQREQDQPPTPDKSPLEQQQHKPPA